MWAATGVVAIVAILCVQAAEVEELSTMPVGAHEGATLLGEDQEPTDMASKAHAKADLALSKIKKAKELREKARQVLKKKGKPIPDILKKGALDDIHKRVVDAKQKLSTKFGPGQSNSELESKMQAKRESQPSAEVAAGMNKANADAETAKIKEGAAEKKAAMYKAKLDQEKAKDGAKGAAMKAKIQAMQQKAKLDKKMQKTEMDGKVMELEVKMKEKAESKMTSRDVQPESEKDFNHRQIAQEAYNKQVMGYVMSWEKTHGGPKVPTQEQEQVKSHLENFVDHYEKQHSQISSDIAVADTPTRR